ncbi:uncharacterized protein UV8b_05221 [Ustilaginoidea virens]|uniref:Uncharacterized protein n=1 Tax=Ustilaginoidea virens TaxID=1159556 RepID=A0A8E5HSS7_USTVR|nr:uncharacterized protein UV8b_05221 [Ustilaginoidea virens]QUC20980.1 hypothetical protein UV8b_05221 [Ustilaginoidea virens]
MQLSYLLSLVSLVAAVPTKRAEPAPLIAAKDASAIVPGRYIVKLKDEVGASAFDDAVKSATGPVHHVYEDVIKGFATSVDEAGLKELQNHADVEYIEHDQVVSASAKLHQANAPWGLARISHRDPGSSEYIYDGSAAAGTCAYVLDSGVDAGHPEFQGRASQLVSFVAGSNKDDNGHGTHVAGTIGSRTYGVAKAIKILGVKVLAANGQGQWSSILAGLEYVAKDSPGRGCPKGVVVNMSLGGPRSQTVNTAAASLVRKGYFIAAAAGNDNIDAGGVSPASEPSVCTVGGTARDDSRYDRSNWGPFVDIHGPAVDVQSTLPGGRSGFLTGTSMATPHITGLAAYLSALTGQRPGPWACKYIQGLATSKKIRGLTVNTVNLLAFNGAT